MKHFFYITLIPLLLSGCCEPIVKTDVKSIVLAPPEIMYKKCDISKPISKEEYMLLQDYEREMYLAKYTSELLNDLKLCNNKLDAIYNWVIKQKEIYNDVK